MADTHVHGLPEDACLSCSEGMPHGECPKSLRPCGHHCNHSWDQDVCHWCEVQFGEEGVELQVELVGGSDD